MAVPMMEYAERMLEAASLMWMELAMFLIALICYVVFSKKGTGFSGGPKAKKIAEGSADASSTEKELMNKIAQNDYRVVVRLWQRVKSQDTAPNVPLIGVVNAMRMLGWPTANIVEDLKSALDCNPSLADGISDMMSVSGKEGLDDAKLIQEVIGLLESRGAKVEFGAWGRLMAAHLRQKDIEGLAATVAGLKPGVVVPSRVHAALITHAAQKGDLEVAMNHLHQMQPNKDEDGSTSKKDSGMAAVVASMGKVLALAARNQRVTEVIAALDVLGIRLEPKQLCDALAEALKTQDAVVCSEIIGLVGGHLAQGSMSAAPRSHEVLSRCLKEDLGRVQLLMNILEDAEVSDNLHELLLTALLDGVGALSEKSVLELLLPKALDRVRATSGMTASTAALASACARACVGCELFEEACDMYLKELEPAGVKLDAELTECLMKAAVQAGKGDLAQSLFDKAPNGDASKYVAEIKLCSRKRDLRGALGVFNRLKSNGIPLNSLIYNCLLDACVQCNDLSGALEHFETMKKMDFVDVVSYNTVLKAYLGLNKVEEAQGLLREMATRGLPANKVTYNELLHARVLAKDRRGMWALIDEMKRSGVKANAVTCSILLKSLTEHSHTSDAEKAMDLVLQTEEQMDEVLFSSVIEACIRLRRLDLLSSMMQKFEKSGHTLSLTAPTYGSMIKAFGQSKDVDRIWDLWREMGSRGVKPTAITLGCMVDALVMNNRVDEAWTLIHDLLDDEDMKSSVNTVIFSTVLKGFAMLRQTDRVFAVHAEMVERQIPCNTITYNTMFDACARCGTMDRVPQLLEDMRQSHADPDIITYSTLVKGFCLAGDIDRSFRVLDEMKSDGKFAPDEIMYNSLLDGCAKLHRVEDAQNLLEDMQEHGVNPSNYTLSILVKLFGRTRRLNQAFKTVEQISAKNGLRPNIHVYTCLMQACIQNRQLDKALTLHDTMVTEGGIHVDEKCYSVLVRGCLQASRPDKAAMTIRCAYGLEGHSMAASWTGYRVPGVEGKLIAETLANLNKGSPSDQEVARLLSADLDEKGIRVDQDDWEPQSQGKGGAKGGSKGKGGGKGGKSARRG
eukprot:gnl/MRDRNA2_/MRDRNA2_86416_c0_seq1.p1 gnl/MRDRNA2_/MRDRNA2_86416_c0~~gnl/MRDRNA2_/MRDRNA2_86416_c0_seq1.p1  ORF type:complete len:1075 (+),score=265.47 gnl/MRDRNA2_/MRDRNA2_86416_c0_seq1:152-3376(+)